MGWKRECLRHTFLGSGTEEDQDQDGMEQGKEAFGSMVKATRLAQNSQVVHAAAKKATF